MGCVAGTVFATRTHRMHRRHLTLLILAIATLGPAARASADVLLTPFAGVSFLNDDQKATFGATVGAGGLFGVELDVSRARVGTIRELSVLDLTVDVTTVMGNLVVRLPAGPVQPYASAGAGLMRLSGNLRVPFLGTVVSASAQDLGVNVGGGLYVLPSDHLGLRADVRYFRRIGDISIDDLTGVGGLDDLPLPRLDFWRATAGVTIRF